MFAFSSNTSYCDDENPTAGEENEVLIEGDTEGTSTGGDEDPLADESALDNPLPNAVEYFFFWETYGVSLTEEEFDWYSYNDPYFDFVGYWF